MSGPREWSPRGKFPKVLRDLMETLRDSGQSEAIAIREILISAKEDPDFDHDLALAILDQFEGWAQYGKKELKKIRPG